MLLNCFLNSLRLDTNISLRNSRRAVLKKSLNKRYIITIVLVNLGRIPLSEAVSAYPLVAQIIADNAQLLLHRPLGDGKNQLIGADAVSKAVVLDILGNHHGYSEAPALARLLLHDVKPVPFTIPYYIAWSELYYIAYPQTEVPFKHKSGCYPFIWSAS